MSWVKSDGSVYFSDPWYGRMPVFGLERERELGFQAVFRIDTGGTLHCEVDDFDQPNGLCFSPDESILYVNDTTRGHIRVFDVSSRRRPLERAHLRREHRRRRCWNTASWTA